MKRVGVAAVIIGVVGGWWLWKSQQNWPAISRLLPSPTPLVSSEGRGLMEVGDYRVAWEEVTKEEEVVVGINREMKYSSQQLAEQLDCRLLTSGAFYDTNNQPLGLLVNQGATLSAWRNNALLHGAVGATDEGLMISREGENRQWKWAVQAGPIVWDNNQAQKVSLINDQEARRIVIGITKENKMVLLAIVGRDSGYGGPKLANVAEVLDMWQKMTGRELIAALNLDGGTASAFITPTLKLKELKPIGSYVCVR